MRNTRCMMILARLPLALGWVVVTVLAIPFALATLPALALRRLGLIGSER